LGAAAEALGITKADLLEQIIRRDDFLPCITQSNNDDQPSNTRQEQEIERLNLAVLDLQQENALLKKRLEVGFPQTADLEAWRIQSLKQLRLGTQAPGYKAAQKALSHFIVQLIQNDKNGIF